ncbi:WD40 repeat-like protein, partial [Hortaea werneckii]
SWDGEKFEQIQRLEGHKGEIWAMMVGRTGETVITASHDKSLRTWQVGDDLIFLEEERERELEEQYESTMAANLDRDYVDETGQQAGTDEVATAGGKQTITTLTHGEKILEALELALPDLDLMTSYSRQKAQNPHLAYPQRHPQFLALGNISAEDYVLSVLRKIPSPALNDALLVLPFSQLPSLFTFLALFLHRRMFPDLAWRVAYFLLQAHMNQIVASTALRPLLEDVLKGYEEWQESQRKLVGFNLAGLEIWGRDVREAERGGGGEGGGFVGGRGMDGEEEEERKMEKGRKKRAFASVA